ncbi:hypothetical protein SUDANB145_01358 [Streptomyces sp. enrichment culture]|uniref:ATP-binding protein n=1 Tax=Streptomyces sp. enrichment culture TaxID=1795815 RepID=UPI003F574F0E
MTPRARFYRRERQSVPSARVFTRRALADWGLCGRTDDMLLCVSELTTNALLHGVPPGRGFLLRLVPYGDGGGVRIEVHDSGDGVPALREPDEGGRGLLLVSELADKWGVEERDPGKTVWCEFAALGAVKGPVTPFPPLPSPPTVTPRRRPRRGW